MGLMHFSFLQEMDILGSSHTLFDYISVECMSHSWRQMLSFKLHLGDFSSEPPRIRTNSCSYSVLRKFDGFMRASCGPVFACSHPLGGIVINDIAWWFSFVKGLAFLGLGHKVHRPQVFFPSSIMWCFFKWHIIFGFFTQNPPKSGWWNWWFWKVIKA